MYNQLYNLLVEGLSQASKKYLSSFRGMKHYASLPGNLFNDLSHAKGEEASSAYKNIPKSEKRERSRKQRDEASILRQNHRSVRAYFRRKQKAKKPELN